MLGKYSFIQMLEFIFSYIPFEETLKYLLGLFIDEWNLILLLVLFFSFRAPFIAFKLIRRNRCLGRNIYRDLAQADRFMEIWSSKSYLSSSEQQYVWAFVPNGNGEAAHCSKIDAELHKLNLIDRIPIQGLYGGTSTSVKSKKGKYLLRNWLVFLLLIWLRVAIFGDRCSHIATGGGKFTEKQLRYMFWAINFILMGTVVIFCLLLIQIF